MPLLGLEGPTSLRETYATDEPAAGYIGFHVCNAAVIVQQFGDVQADRAAKEALQEALPDRAIEPVAIDDIAAGGGSIHCATQRESRSANRRQRTALRAAAEPRLRTSQLDRNAGPS